MSMTAESLAADVRTAPDAFIDERDRRRLLFFTARMFRGYTMAMHISDELVPALEWAAKTPNARLIVTLPPRFSKSLHVSEHLPAWYLGNYPDNRVIAASHTAGLAYTFSRRVRNKPSDPRWPFPNVRVADDKGAVQAWDIDGHHGGYIAVGVGGSPTGHGANLIIIDDPIRSAADADSEVVREGLWEWYRETIRTRLEPNGSIIVTATRWHEDDLTGRLLREAKRDGEQWRHVHMPALNDDGTSLWPERWPVDALERIRASVGSRGWEAQYQGRPTPAEGGILKKPWLRFWQYRRQGLEPVTLDGLTLPLLELPGYFDQQLQSWDLSFKQTTSGSYVAGLVAGVLGAQTYLLDRYRERTDFPGTVTAFLRMTERWPQATVKLVEDKANGPALMDTLRSHVAGIVSVSPDGTKEARMHAASPYVEGGGLVLPHPANAPWVTEFIDEITAFPLAAHDDQADALSQLLRRVMANTQGGFAMGDVMAAIYGGA